MKSLVVTLALLLGASTAAAQDHPMTFFLVSHGLGDGANLGGLDGADRHCQVVAESVGSEGIAWRAYLSTPAGDGRPAIHARERIGSGPWYNARGVMIAESVDQLHGDNNLTKETQLNERGEVVNGRGDTPNRHDILTGSQLNGTAFASGEDTTCHNWTSNAETGSARVGHHDRTGGGQHPSSWNSAHGSRGCSQANLRATGGDALYYCFGIG